MGRGGREAQGGAGGQFGDTVARWRACASTSEWAAAMAAPFFSTRRESEEGGRNGSSSRARGVFESIAN
jgi:hypothetical protein